MTLFVQRNDGRLVRDAWNFPEAFILHDTHERILPFPTDYETLCDTLALVPKLGPHEKGHDREIVLKGEGEVGQSTVVLRLQGYLHQLKLGRLGDWDADLKTCLTAANTLHLEAGNAAFNEQWSATWNTLRSIRRWVGAVSHAVCADNPPTGDMDTIRCSRRAFTKASPSAATVELDGNDPLYHAAQRVKRMWIPEPPIAFGVRRADGSVSRAHPAIFSRGDFVDVAVTFDIVKRDNGKVNVYLRLEHVIQLASVENQKAMSIKALRGVGSQGAVERQASTTVAFVEDEDSL